jgi:excinuclease ABC subunit B
METRMREAAADLDFETAARLRDEIKRLKQTELAVLDNPTARDVMSAQTKGLRSPSPRLRGEGRGVGASPKAQTRGDAPAPGSLRDPTSPRAAGRGDIARPHKPHLDEMGIATWHEFKPARDEKSKPRKPNLDEMGPGVESVPAKRGAARGSGRSHMGRPGQHGGFKANKRRR